MDQPQTGATGVVRQGRRHGRPSHTKSRAAVLGQPSILRPHWLNLPKTLFLSSFIFHVREPDASAVFRSATRQLWVFQHRLESSEKNCISSIVRKKTLKI
jgi:hypothetical protein